MTLLFLYVGGALSTSFLCSILEAALLSVRITELVERRDAGDVSAGKLLKLKEERIDDAISAILTLNTVAHTIGATLAGAQAAVDFGSEYLGVFSGVLTLLVLVLTEIIPKTLGTVHASTLVPFVVRTLHLIMFLFTPVLAVSRKLTRLVSHGEADGVSRGELVALVSIASREGAIRESESLVLANVLQLERITAQDVMTPRIVAVMRSAETTLEEFIADEGASIHSRIPIFQDNRDQLEGYILQDEILRAAATGVPKTKTLGDFKRPVWYVTGDTSLLTLLRESLKRREHMAIVTNDFGGVSGILTLEDIVETLLGTEILDETDDIADLRERALELRNRRLAKFQSEVISEDFEESEIPEGQKVPESEDGETTPSDPRTPRTDSLPTE